MTIPRTARRRLRPAATRLTAGALVTLVALIGATYPPPAEEPSPHVPAATGPAARELPRGGRSILPEFRVYAHYGAPQAKQLGILGIGTPAVAGARLNRQSRAYGGPGRRPVLPAMELIGVIATAGPGAGGKYRARQTRAVILRYLRAARAAKALLVLDIQPGRSDFVTEAKALREFVVQPDVGLALDPEWRMGPTQMPGQVIGSVDAAEINRVTAWLAGVVAAHDLPDKLVIVHQFTEGMIRRKRALRVRPGIDMVLNADGFGTAAAKTNTYQRVVRDRGPFHTGFKLFRVEDTGLMSPGQVMRLRPRPEVVISE